MKHKKTACGKYYPMNATGKKNDIDFFDYFGGYLSL